MENVRKKGVHWLVWVLGSLIVCAGGLIVASVAAMFFFLYLPWNTFDAINYQPEWRPVNVRTMAFTEPEEFATAESKLKKLVSKKGNEGDPIPNYLLGSLYQSMDRRDEAMKSYENTVKAVSAGSTNWYDRILYKGYVDDAHGQMALLAYQGKDDERARGELGMIKDLSELSDAEMLIALNDVLEEPSRADYHFRLGLALHHALDLPNARREYEQAVALSTDPKLKLEAEHYLTARMPKKGKVISPMALYYIKAGDYSENEASDLDRAVVFYDKAIQAAPDFEWAYYHLGMVYRELHNEKKSVEYSRKALSLNPDFFLPYLTLGEVAMDRENYQQAIIYYNKAMALGANLLETEESGMTANIQNQLGYAYEQMDKVGVALSHYKEALEIAEEDSEDYAYAEEAIERLKAAAAKHVAAIK